MTVDELTHDGRPMKYRHGQRGAYVLDRCRCPDCRRENTTYNRQLAQRLEPPYVSAGPARRHLAELAAAGVGLNQVARVSGVSHGALSKLVHGMPTRPPSKRIRKTTLDAILAVTPADIAAGAKVPAGPTWALIDEMLAAGAPRARIAEALGFKGPGLQLAHTTVTAADPRQGHPHDPRPGRGRRAAQRPAVAGRAKTSSSFGVRGVAGGAATVRPPWRSRRTSSICRACTVRDQCRAAMFDEPVGVYGGLSADARRRATQVPA